MERFIGTKIIKAVSMNRYEFSMNVEGVDCKEKNREGFMVGYSDADGNFDGPLQGGCHYISWSPADVFEASYSSIKGLSFGQAIEAMKTGGKVARTGWNGKKMFIYIVDGSEVKRCELRGAAHRHYPHLCQGKVADDIVPICPHIDMKAADDTIVVGWLASQTDILSEDWMIVE